MAQQYSLEASNTFIKGLITEAGELTFPKDASVDELNCDLLRTGARRRRLGVQFESSYEESTETVTNSTVLHTVTWENVGNEAGTEFLGVQIGSDLIFYEKSTGAFSGSRVTETFISPTEYVLDLTAYERPSTNGAETDKITAASINGALVVASPEINTIYIERDISTGAFTVTEIEFKERDFDWQSPKVDLLSNSAGSSVDVERKYDTYNVGWVPPKGDDALSTFRSSKSKWPALSMPWYAAKDSSGNFSVAEWDKIHSGNTLAVNGHYIVDLYNTNRDSVSGLSGLAAETEDARFSTVAAYAGRVFYSGMENSTNGNGSKVYFSQLLEDNFTNIGSLYQVNDPTSEIVSDLLDTDGGFIRIPDAYSIKRMHVFGAVLYVFAENGVWSISGVDDVFRATQYSVAKISEEGLAYKHSFVSANGRPYWWSANGINTLGLQETIVVSNNISLPTIQTFWNEIDGTQKSDAIGIYDGSNNRVLWLYPDADETVTTKFNNILLFDETLGAFFPWKISDQASSTSMIVGGDFYKGLSSNRTTYNVIDSSADTVVDASTNDVVVFRTGRAFSSSAIKFLVRVGGTNTLTFAEFTNTDFVDWGDANYTSYAEAAYDFMGNLSFNKNAPYITTYLKSTETGWESNGNGGYDPIRPSSIKVSGYWDFKRSASSTPQQAYRFAQTPIVDTGSLATWDYPKEVIRTRLKIRGKGKVLKLRFDSESGKDFHLLGYEVIHAANTRL